MYTLLYSSGTNYTQSVTRKHTGKLFSISKTQKSRNRIKQNIPIKARNWTDVKKRRKRIAAQNWTRNSKGSVFFRLLIKVIMKKQFDRGRLKQSLSATVVIFRKVFGQRYSAVTCLLQSKSQDFR